MARRRVYLGVLQTAWGLCAILTAGGLDSAERVAWRGAAEARQELEGTIRLTWPSNPLRESLDNLARTRRVAIWLDRRIDPDQKVEFKSNEVPLRTALSQLADQLSAGVCLVGPVVYIGPRETAARLYELSGKRRTEAGQLAEEVRKRLGRSQAWQWNELAEPRELLSQLAAEAGVKLVGTERVPHDLWPAGDLPSLTVVDRLSLVLAGFDQTFEYSSDGETLRLAPYPTSSVTEKTFSVKGDVGQFAQKLAGLMPTAKISVGPGKVSVVASAADHLRIEQLLKDDGPRRTPIGGKKVYTLKLDNQPVSTAARAIAKQMDLEVKFDDKLPPEQLESRVSMQVKDATADELFDILLKPAGLMHKLNGKTLEISAR